MEAHIEVNHLMQTVDIYLQLQRGYYAVINDSNSMVSVEVPEGTIPPKFLSLSMEIWKAITDQVPNEEEQFTRSLLQREQGRVDKLIDHLLK